MTFSNTIANPYPTANPMNGVLHGNNGSSYLGTAFKRCRSNQSIPQAKMYGESDFSQQNDLHVPYQNQVPMGCEGNFNMLPLFNPDLFQCPDGTVLNIKTGKIIKNSINQDKNWGDGKIKWIQKGTETEKVWNNNEIRKIDPFAINNNTTQLSKDDIEYQKYSEIKNKELEQNMNDEQKELLRQLKSGQITRKTKLIEEK